jgi:predicted N-acetyltransferase YhbS
MGRLPVDLRYRGRGLGAELLVNALHRAAKSEIPAVALTVDAKDGIAADFYRHFGMMQLSHDPLALFLPWALIRYTPLRWTAPGTSEQLESPQCASRAARLSQRLRAPVGA